MIDILDGALKLIKFVANGIINFVDFIISLPSFIYELLEVLPSPLYDIVLTFISLIIFIMVLAALGKVVSSVK